MSRERDIFLHVLEVDSPGARASLLESLCAGDADLLARVQTLLNAHEAGPGFLDAAAVPAPGAPISTEQPGSVVGRYRLLEQIGEGGFGVVYMAEQREPVKRKVALKIIKLGMDTRQVVARFEAERQALALMDHPSIAKVLDAGATETGRPYFVMELVRGMPVTKFCDDNQATTGERLELFVQVCSAIQHAHQKGIIHRDIKPNNVLITMHDDRPVPKVIDFGIAKATQQELTDKTIFTRYHEFLGTPAYMSPEQTQLSGLDIDTRSDIYSLGVLLYELLTGHTPFDAQELLSGGYDEIRRRIRDQEPLKPSTKLNTLAVEDRERVARKRRSEPKHLGRVLRGDLDRIVMKAMEKDRTRRYESASAFGQDVRRYLNDEPVTAVAPSFGYRLRKFVRRHRTALPVAAAIAGLLVAGTMMAIWQAWRADRAAATALTEAATAEAVTRFLNDDLFSMADPENEPDHEITVRALLDRASKQLPGGLSNQPLVQAAILSTIGRAYANLSQHSAALKHLRQAHDLYQRELGERHEKSVRALLDIATALEQRGHTTPAVPAAERARDLALAEFGENHPLTVQCLSRLAYNYYRLRRRDDAFAVAVQAWEAARRVSAAPEIEVYPALLIVARRRSAMGEPEAGESLLRHALQSHEVRFGPHHRRTLRAMNGLAGYLYDKQCKLDEAERLFRESLKAQLSVVGENHDATQLVRRNLALLLESTHRPAEALQELLKILTVRPVFKEAVEDVARVLPQAPLPSLATATVSGQLSWRFTDQPPQAGWRQRSFDDERWEADAPRQANEVWARCRVELAALPGAQVAVKIQGPGSYELFVNDVAAVLQFGATKDGFQFAVLTEEARRTLNLGDNVVTLHARDLRGDAPLVIELFTSPPLGDKTP